MHSQGFPRLIKKMDEIAGRVEEKVIMQIGTTEYRPMNAEFFNFANYKKMQHHFLQSRVVICHGGEGSIMDALSFGKPCIAVPRLKKYNEHNNNHQLEIVDVMSKEGKLIAVHDINELENALLNVNNSKKINERSVTLINFLRKYLANLSD